MTDTPSELWVNDVHSGLNATPVRGIETPRTVGELVPIIRRCGAEKVPVSVSGSRHAMGGQQFLRNGGLIDLRGLNRLIHFDRATGLLQVEAGIQWPALMEGYLSLQQDDGPQWGIAQKQTGADHLTLGGSLGANAHGRGLLYRPLIQDVEAFTLLRADACLVRCSRQENRELFSLVIGGYGLFGIITEVTLRLVPRQRLERRVEIVSSRDLPGLFAERIAAGCTYGDFQFSIDERAPDFLQRGVFSCYQPTDRPVPAGSQAQLREEDWMQLLHLAYTDRSKVFERYSAYYLSTNGQVYWSDTHQLGPYLPDYARRIAEMGATSTPSSLLITELYVPREKLPVFLAEAAVLLRERQEQVIYGTVRLIEQDTESFLAWARESFACVIFNLLVGHSSAGQQKAAESFRALIDLATTHGGSYFLTYHRHASRAQVEACYPQFGHFLALKKKHDPSELFQSDWYRHYASQ